MIEKLFIYHTNDLHSYFNHWPKVTAFLNERKKWHNQRSENMMFFDIGDHMDRVHPVSEATLGIGNVELMNEVGYHNVTIGNNEGITLSKEELNQLYDGANFQVVCANLFTEEGILPSWLKPYDIHTLNNNLTVGVIGITVAFKQFYEQLGWKINDPFSILPTIVADVKQKADIVILLSHLGLSDDEQLAREIPGIDIILGGHTHHLLKSGKVINNTLICGAGKFGAYVGEVMLKYDTDARSIIRKEAAVNPVDHQQPSQGSLEKIKNLIERSQQKLDESIGHLEEDLELSWYEESQFAQLLADALKEWCHTEISMVNSGVLLEPLQQGPITLGDLHRICPHPINPCRVMLRGDKLKEVIQQSLTERMQNLEVNGFGFRGKVLGKMVFTGVTFYSERLEDGLVHIREIRINGESIDFNRDYSIATLDMFTFGHLYPEIAHSKGKKYYLPEMLRDVLRWKLERL